MNIQEATVSTVGEGWRGLEVEMDLTVWKSLSLLRHFTLNILSRVRPTFTSTFTAFKGEVQLFFSLDEFMFTVSSVSNGLEVSGIDTAARLQCFSRWKMKLVCKKLLWLQKDQKPHTHQTKKNAYLQPPPLLCLLCVSLVLPEHSHSNRWTVRLRLGDFRDQ